MHRRFLRLAHFVAAMALVVIIANIAYAAETWSQWGTINWMEAGWKEDTIAVGHSSPIINPDACQFAHAYVTDPKDPGHNLFHAVALSAFMNKKEVRFLISGCAFGKPHIIGVGVR